MKITRKQLRQIIKEEFTILTEEQEINRDNFKSIIDSKGVETVVELIVGQLENISLKVEELWDEYEPL
tara:strand:- start:6675 stop:6878 length:204 start_codon:yes stop_codon:yes gene_type:complete